MGKLILLGIAVIVVVWLLRRALSKPPAGAAAPPAGAGDLVSCAHCGLNLPKGEARSADAAGAPRYYCSEEHLRAGPRKG